MSLQLRKLRVVISGGGTGGHIFPAIAIANALKKINSENEFLFVGALGKMEMEKVPAAGFKIEGLNISGIQRKSIIKNLMLPFKVISSVMKAKKIIRNFSPDVAVGVGGYASGPLLFAATSMKIPSLIQEQNSFAGVTNKMLSGRVQKICVAYEGMEAFFPYSKIIVTGNPVREDIVSIEGKREAAIDFFHLGKGKKTVLVVGGSLGAKTINESILDGLKTFMENDIRVIWQTGKIFSVEAKEILKTISSDNVYRAEFIQRMDYAYAAADLIISRAGASSVSELSIVGKPVILVPSPNVAEDHQTKNALALVKKNAAVLIADADARRKLVPKTIELLMNENYLRTLGANIKKLAINDSAGRIADEIYRIVNPKPHS